MQITSLEMLDFTIKADRMMNRGVFEYPQPTKKHKKFTPDPVMRYLETMRKLSYYGTRTDEESLEKTRTLIYDYERLGRMLHLFIDCDAFDYGLVIPGCGPVNVGGSNFIGSFAILYPNTCIAPRLSRIGDGLCMYEGSKVLDRVELGDGITLEEGTWVCRSYRRDNLLLSGRFSRVKKRCKRWYEADPDSVYKARAQMVQSEFIKTFNGKFQ